MQNTKVLEMINNGQIEELKALLQDEIFTDSYQRVFGKWLCVNGIATK